ncbi:MAG: hypothetical protein P1U56_23000 [Saprospiraceae bacterium]|nr:hypothetical protein [Saprospiraceae bacterium]
MNKILDTIKNIFAFLIIFFGGINSYCQDQIILPDVPQDNTSWGFDIDANDEFLIVGEPGFNRDIDSINKGRVHIYRLIGENWLLFDQLLPTSDSIFDNHNSGFGIELSINNNELAIADPNKQLVSIYKFDSFRWNKKQDISVLGDGRMRLSLDLSDNYLIIGNSTAQNLTDNEGVVLIYQRNNEDWVLSDEIYPPENLDVFHFGHDLSFDGSQNLLIGSRKVEEEDGGAFLFSLKEEDWILSQVFKDGSQSEQGLIVQIDVNKLAISGGNIDNTRIEVYHNETSEWELHQVFSIYMPVLPYKAKPIEVIHFSGSHIFLTEGLGGQIEYFEYLEGEYVFRENYPKNKEDILFFDYIINGFSAAVTKKYLFSSALTYGITLEEKGHGAVLVFQRPQLNPTQQSLDASKFFVTPNPGSEYIRLHSNIKKKYVIHSIIGYNGKISYPKVEDNIIDIKDLQQGIYFLKIIDQFSKELKYTSFIKI